MDPQRLSVSCSGLISLLQVQRETLSQKSKGKSNCGRHLKPVFYLYMYAHIFTHTCTRTHTRILQVLPHGDLGHPPPNPYVCVNFLISFLSDQTYCNMSFPGHFIKLQFTSMEYRNIYKSSHSDRSFHKVYAPMSKKHRSGNTTFLSLIL